MLRARAAPPPPAAARGAHRPRLLRCWGQETDCFWREKQKGQKDELFLERAARCRGGPFPPPLCPSSNSTPGKLGFESSLGERCERDARGGRGRAGTLEAERPEGGGPEPPPPRATFTYLGIPSEADLNPFPPPPVVSKAREAVPSSLTTFRRPGLRPYAAVAATVAAAGADSAHSAPSLQPAQFGQPCSGRTLGSTRASLSPSGCHSYTLQTLLSLWFPFITSGWEWPRTLGRRPRGWGRLDQGLALHSLVKGSVWVRRPELDWPDV